MGNEVRDNLVNLRKLLRALIKGAESGEYTVERMLDGTITVAGVEPRQLRRLERFRLILKRHGKLGARRLEIAPRPRGTAAVRIDGGEWIRLTPRLAQLVMATAESGKCDASGLPEWRTTEDVAQRMGELSGKPVAPSSLANLCLRLRNVLVDHLENPYYLHTREGAIRFAAREVVWASGGAQE